MLGVVIITILTFVGRFQSFQNQKTVAPIFAERKYFTPVL
jgi:hypothetical protein